MKVVFMGSPAFAVPALRAVAADHEVVLVVTQPDKKAGRGRKLTPPPVKVVADELRLETLQPKSARKPEFADAMVNSGADIAIVVAYGKILPLAVLEAFPLGCLNIHGSILPEWRGAAPIQRAVMSGQRETGVSIMQLDEGMDTGPVFSTATLVIEDGDTTATLAEKMAPVGAELLLKTLREIANGTAKAVAQDDAKASHAAMLEKTDGAIHWGQTAQLVSAHIRGVDPWPGAYSDKDGIRYKLFGASIRPGSGQPGEVISVDGELVVACESGAVAILEVQVPGKRRVPAADFARSGKLGPGDVLGL